MDYETLIDLAAKIEQQIKEDSIETFEPIQFSDLVRNSKALGKREVLTLVYGLAKEAQNG